MFDSAKIGEEIALHLGGDNVVFVKCDPPLSDATKASDSFLCIFGKSAVVRLPLKEQIRDVQSLVAFFFDDPSRRIVSWDIKPLLTYFRFHAPQASPINCTSLIDLRLCESYLSVSQPAPLNLVDALRRLKGCLSSASLLKIHKAVHLPLVTKVLPAIETCGVVDESRRRTLYPSYTVEGHVAGRMSCHLGFDVAINPHSLDYDHLSVLVPKPPFTHFVQLDYKANEVSVLQWLSKDERLGAILADKSRDLYEEVYKIVAGTDECGSEQRSLAKSFFLPVFFGMQPFALSQKLGISKPLAEQIIGLIGEKFSTAWNWVQSQHDLAQAEGKIIDYFGRVRLLDEPYIARHFCIAAPAALICLERLIKLHETLDPEQARIVFSIHDGYLITAKRKFVQAAIIKAKEVLEAEIPICPGLRLRTSAEGGLSLGKMCKLY